MSSQAKVVVICTRKHDNNKGIKVIILFLFVIKVGIHNIIRGKDNNQTNKKNIMKKEIFVGNRESDSWQLSVCWLGWGILFNDLNSGAVFERKISVTAVGRSWYYKKGNFVDNSTKKGIFFRVQF